MGGLRLHRAAALHLLLTKTTPAPPPPPTGREGPGERVRPSLTSSPWKRKREPAWLVPARGHGWGRLTDLSVELGQRRVPAVHPSPGGQRALRRGCHGLALGAVAAPRQLSAQGAAVLGGGAWGAQEEEEEVSLSVGTPSSMNTSYCS